MSEQIDRPAPASAELVERADAPRSRAERFVSTVTYYAGPEVTVITVVGGGGAWVLHPMALPVVAVVTAVWSVTGRIIGRRSSARLIDQAAAVVDQVDADNDRTEGVA